MYLYSPEAATRTTHDQPVPLKILRRLLLYGIAGNANTQEKSYVVS